MAKIRTKAVDPKIYRHFAVITVVATVLLAVFASGENREAIAAAAEAHQDELARERAASRPAYGNATLVENQRQPAHFSDFGDTGGSFGEPMDRTGAQVQDVGRLEFTPQGRGTGDNVPQSYAQYGISAAELASLTPAQRAALLARIRAGGMSSDPEEREQQIADLIASSSGRSGENVEIE
jgi:hypothetical protein